MKLLRLFVIASLMHLASPSAQATLTCEYLFNSQRQSAASSHFAFRTQEDPSVTEKRRQFVEDFNAPSSQMGAKFPNIKAELDQNHRTVRFVHASGRIQPGAKARLLLLHGNGASYSRGWTMTQILRSLSEPGATNSSTVKALRRDPNFLPVSAEAIDQPGCGEGPALAEYPNAARTAEWLASYVREMKRETPDLPIIVLTRSSSAMFAVEAAKKHPELIDALILMSPSHPGDPAVFDGGFKAVMEELKAGLFEANMPNLMWVKGILEQERWDQTTFKKPTFIITGSADPETSPLERTTYTSYAQTNPNVSYRDFTGAGHNVLDTNKKETKDAALVAYQDILAFIKSIVER